MIVNNGFEVGRGRCMIELAMPYGQNKDHVCNIALTVELGPLGTLRMRGIKVFRFREGNTKVRYSLQLPNYSKAGQGKKEDVAFFQLPEGLVDQIQAVVGQAVAKGFQNLQKVYRHDKWPIWVNLRALDATLKAPTVPASDDPADVAFDQMPKTVSK